MQKRFLILLCLTYSCRYSHTFLSLLHPNLILKVPRKIFPPFTSSSYPSCGNGWTQTHTQFFTCRWVIEKHFLFLFYLNLVLQVTTSKTNPGDTPFPFLWKALMLETHHLFSVPNPFPWTRHVLLGWKLHSLTEQLCKDGRVDFISKCVDSIQQDNPGRYLAQL